MGWIGDSWGTIGQDTGIIDERKVDVSGNFQLDALREAQNIFPKENDQKREGLIDWVADKSYVSTDGTWSEAPRNLIEKPKQKNKTQSSRWTSTFKVSANQTCAWYTGCSLKIADPRIFLLQYVLKFLNTFLKYFMSRLEFFSV